MAHLKRALWFLPVLALGCTTAAADDPAPKKPAVEYVDLFGGPWAGAHAYAEGIANSWREAAWYQQAAANDAAAAAAQAALNTERSVPTPVIRQSGTSWDAVAACESGGNWSTNTGNGYYGGLQFDSQTWDAYGNPAYGEANEAPPEEQIAAAERMPYDGWPNC